MDPESGLLQDVDETFWAGQTVLVTGASGFKGGWLCEALCVAGARVIGTVRSKSNHLSFYSVRQLGTRTDAAQVDITNPREVMDLINTTSPNVIFHLAAKALVPVSQREPLQAFNTNVIGTLNVLEACRKLRIVDRVVICSTDHVFGNPPGMTEYTRFDEDSPLRHSGPYDSSKAAMELGVRCYCETYPKDLPAVAITRCANVFGPGDVNQRRIIPEFIRDAQTKHRIGPLYLKNRRQYVYVLDAVRGYMKAAEHLERGRPETVYHFALEEYVIDGQVKPSISSQELAEVVASIARRHGSIVSIDEKDVREDFAPNENRFQALDCTRTRRDLNWHPHFSLEDGLDLTYQWHESMHKGSDSPANFLESILNSARK